MALTLWLLLALIGACGARGRPSMPLKVPNANTEKRRELLGAVHRRHKRWRKWERHHSHSAAGCTAEDGRGDVILRWNNQTLDTVRSKELGAAEASRTYAMVNLAMFDAVNGIDLSSSSSKTCPRYPALVGAVGAPKCADREAAAAAAAHAVLAGLYPDMADTYNAQLAEDLESRSGDNFDRGVQWGAMVGRQVVTARKDDGSSPSETLAKSDQVGEFRQDWTSAQYRNMDPFGIKDKAPYRSPGPPALDSPEYARDHSEARLEGDASDFNQTKEEIFRFWKGGSGSARPPGEWIKIGQVVAEQQGTTKSLSGTARLFALLSAALADSTIVAWDSKFTYRHWRPQTAIREANTDGNSETVQVDGWTPRNGSPGSSPEHTSGQSTFAGAGSTVLAAFYCTDQITFTFEGDDAIAGERTYTSFSEAAAEAGQARIFAGIHFRFSDQAGQAAGRALANEILGSFLRCRHCSHCA
ncbi:unnamed protein product [Vitrella brassicaformis CCMP3155]|uniref:Uncharacterized protein n=2 Tax=Vitrella brassicaformis TaxID=1169539 RepID=A0A0G4GWS2_VITBC|nr:unnamed protein product [Vitrella brassicaformis CCMP3155]|eukprot:CEM35436.1 unnamed protein product [Vitrella brassicaformis CCMP3155]